MEINMGKTWSEAAILSLVTTVLLAILGGCGKNETPVTTIPGESKAAASPSPSKPLNCDGCVPVDADNFPRAETDLYFGSTVKEAEGIGKFHHFPGAMPIDNQTVVRGNRDTLYSTAVFDLDASPVTVTLPDAGMRYMAMQLINEDQYTPMVVYGKGTYTLTKDKSGTRYVLTGIRTLFNPEDPQDIQQVHALQKAIKVSQKTPGSFEIPKWDPVSQNKVRESLVALGSTLPDMNHAFGAKGRSIPCATLSVRLPPGEAILTKMPST